MQATKIKEVWRNPNGSFAKAPEPVVEAPAPKKDYNAEMGAMLLIVTIGFLTLAFWQVTLPVVGSIGAGHLTHKYFKQKQSDLPINHYI